MHTIGGALEANLARTAVDVVVPPEHAILLEITARWRGVHDATEQLLREIHHDYVAWGPMLNDLHRRAMGDSTTSTVIRVAVRRSGSSATSTPPSSATPYLARCARTRSATG